jgi:hypothetical protein
VPGIGLREYTLAEARFWEIDRDEC